MKKLFNEFKAFAIKGNVIDMAVGVIIGGAFTGIVNSLVGDILTPIISLLVGGIDFSSFVLEINGAVIHVGNSINAVVSFLITAVAIFALVKAINSLHKKEEVKPEEPATPSEDILLLQEIRDLLKEKNK